MSGDIISSLPVFSQLKSLAQVITGDAKGARLTQERFLNHGILVSQVKSAVQAISGDTEGAKLTQEKFLAQQVKILQGTGRLFTGYHLADRLNHEARLARKPTWMAEIPDNASIWGLTLPGTHHSTAFAFKKTEFGLPFHRTQRFNIREQLYGGIRWLHCQCLRDMGTHELMCCTHQRDTRGKPYGRAYMTIPFVELLAEIRHFLDSFTCEVIFLHIEPAPPPEAMPPNSRTEPKAFWLDVAQDALGLKLHRPKLRATTPLGDVRGRCILVQSAQQIWSSLPHTRTASPHKVVPNICSLLKKRRSLMPSQPSTKTTRPISREPVPPPPHRVSSSRSGAADSSSSNDTRRGPGGRSLRRPPPAPTSLPPSSPAILLSLHEAGGQRQSRSDPGGKPPPPPEECEGEGNVQRLDAFLASSPSPARSRTTTSTAASPEGPGRAATRQAPAPSGGSVLEGLRSFPPRPSKNYVGPDEREGCDERMGSWQMVGWGAEAEARAKREAEGSGALSGGGYRLASRAAASERLVIYHAHVSPSHSLRGSAHQVVSVGGGLMSDSEVTNKHLLQELFSNTAAMAACQVLLVDFVHSKIVEEVVKNNRRHLNLKVPFVRNFPAVSTSAVKFQRVPRWLSEDLETSLDDSQKYAPPTIKASCNHKVSINQGVVKDGVTVWVDRPYTFCHIPKQILGGTIVRWPHRLPFNTKIDFTFPTRSTLYVVVERFERNGGLPRALRKRGWLEAKVAPTIPESKYHNHRNRPLVMMYKAVNPGVLNLPALVEETCLATVVVQASDQSSYKKQPLVLEKALKIVEHQTQMHQNISNIVERENELLEMLLRFAMIPARETTVQGGEPPQLSGLKGVSDDRAGDEEKAVKISSAAGEHDGMQDSSVEEAHQRPEGVESDERNALWSAPETPWEAACDFSPLVDGDLTVSKGDAVLIQGEAETPGWLFAETANGSGYLPRALLTPRKQVAAPYPAEPAENAETRVPRGGAAEDGGEAEAKKEEGKVAENPVQPDEGRERRRRRQRHRVSPPAPKSRPPLPPQQREGDTDRKWPLKLRPRRTTKQKSADARPDVNITTLLRSPEEPSGDDRGSALWSKLIALAPEYRDKEQDFRGIFGRWIIEVLQDELFRVASQRLTRGCAHSDSERDRSLEPAGQADALSPRGPKPSSGRSSPVRIGENDGSADVQIQSPSSRSLSVFSRRGSAQQQKRPGQPASDSDRGGGAAAAARSFAAAPSSLPYTRDRDRGHGHDHSRSPAKGFGSVDAVPAGGGVRESSGSSVWDREALTSGDEPAEQSRRRRHPNSGGNHNNSTNSEEARSVSAAAEEELARVKAQIEDEGRRGHPDADRMKELLQRLAQLSDTITSDHEGKANSVSGEKLGFLAHEAGSAQVSGRRHSVSLSQESEAFNKDQTFDENGDRHFSSSSSAGSMRSELANELRAAGFDGKHHGGAPSPSAFRCVPLDFATVYLRGEVDVERYPAILGTGILYPGGVDVVLLDLGFGFASVPRASVQLPAEAWASEAGLTAMVLMANKMNPNTEGLTTSRPIQKLAQISVGDTVRELLVELEMKHMQHWFTLETLKRNYHRERVQQLDDKWKKRTAVLGVQSSRGSRRGTRNKDLRRNPKQHGIVAASSASAGHKNVKNNRIRARSAILPKVQPRRQHQRRSHIFPSHHRFVVKDRASFSQTGVRKMESRKKAVEIPRGKPRIVRWWHVRSTLNLERLREMRRGHLVKSRSRYEPELSDSSSRDFSATRVLPGEAMTASTRPASRRAKTHRPNSKTEDDVDLKERSGEDGSPKAKAKAKPKRTKSGRRHRSLKRLFSKSKKKIKGMLFGSEKNTRGTKLMKRRVRRSTGSCKESREVRVDRAYSASRSAENLRDLDSEIASLSTTSLSPLSRQSPRTASPSARMIGGGDGGSSRHSPGRKQFGIPRSLRSKRSSSTPRIEVTSYRSRGTDSRQLRKGVQIPKRSSLALRVTTEPPRATPHRKSISHPGSVVDGRRVMLGDGSGMGRMGDNQPVRQDTPRNYSLGRRNIRVVHLTAGNTQAGNGAIRAPQNTPRNPDDSENPAGDRVDERKNRTSVFDFPTVALTSRKMIGGRSSDDAQSDVDLPFNTQDKKKKTRARRSLTHIRQSKSFSVSPLTSLRLKQKLRTAGDVKQN